MSNGVFGSDGTPISRDGTRIIPDGGPFVIERRRPNHRRVDGFFPDMEEERRQAEEARRRARDRRRDGVRY